MNIGIIIQARLGSTRLPGKILLSFYKNKSILDLLLERFHKIKDVKVIVATSENPNNNKLVDYLKSNNEKYFIGSENDVLDRFIKAAEANQCDGIIRICSDNPFLDLEGIKELINRAKTSNADYIGFRINNKPSIQTHFGFWGEFVTLNALKRIANDEKSTVKDLEHVTYHIYNHPDNFKCEWIETPEFLQNRDDIRLTVDTIEDFKNASKVYKDLNDSGLDINLQNIVNYLDSNPEVKESMHKNILQNTK